MSTKVNAASDLKSKLLDRSAKAIEGILGCYDRLIITGLLVEVGPPEAITTQLRHLNIRCFDLGVLAEPLRDQVRDNASLLARQAGLEIQYLERKGIRKEARVAEILRQRGRHPGLVHIFSAMESCKCFKPWHDMKGAIPTIDNQTPTCHGQPYGAEATSGIFRGDLSSPFAGGFGAAVGQV